MIQHPDWRAVKAGQEYGRIIENQEALHEMYLDSLNEDPVLCQRCGDDLMLTDGRFCQSCVEEHPDDLD